jgi:hypothetical protein
MAVRSGFWNSNGSDIRRYYNSDFSHLISLLINDGVSQNYGGSLIPTTGNGMTVVIQTGEAWFNDIWLRNDTDLVIDIDAAPIVAGYSRLDAIAIKIDASSGVRDGTIVYMAGTPTAGTPTLPEMVDTADIHWHILASVLVKTNDTSIPRERITNYVGSNTAPLITGLLETVSAEDLIQQWQAEFNSWNSNKQAEFEAWVETIQGILDEEAAGHLQLEIEDLYSKTHTNLLNPTLNSTTLNGVTCTANGDGTYTLNGTASAAIYFGIVLRADISQYNLKHGVFYKLVGCPSGGGGNRYILDLYKYNSENTLIGSVLEDGNGKTFDFSDEEVRTEVGIRCYSGQTYANVTFKPMLTTDLSATYDDFVPYSGPGELNENVAEMHQLVGDSSDLPFQNHTVTKNIERLQSQIARIETTNTATNSYAVGEYLVLGSQLRKVTAPIAVGDAITPANTTFTRVDAELTRLLNNITDVLDLVSGLNFTGIGHIEQLNKHFMLFTCSSNVPINSSITMPIYTKGLFITPNDSGATDGMLLAVDSAARLYVAFRNNSSWNYAKVHA